MNERTVAIVYNHYNSDAHDLMLQIKEEISSLGYEIISFSSHSEKKVEKIQAKTLFLVISIGGDGTVLGVARDFPNMPILAINGGRLGFVTGSSRENWRTFFDLFVNGQAVFSTRLMLEAIVYRNNETVFSQVGLNEAVVSSGGISRLIDLGVLVDTHVLYRFRADGVIVATPTGSTAHSRAAGGPVMTPEMEAFVINPISPFTLGVLPVVTDSNSTILLEIEYKNRHEANLTLDGQIVFPLEKGDKIEIKKADNKCRIIQNPDINFFQTAKEKLHWAGGIDD